MKAHRMVESVRLMAIHSLAVLALSVSRPLTQAGEASQAGLTELRQVNAACDRFMRSVSNGDTNAFTFIEDYWIARESGAKISNAASRQWAGAEPVFKLNAGRRIGGAVDFLGARHIGTNLVKRVYLLQYEQGFLPWSLTFYRSGREWHLSQFVFGDSAKEDLPPMERPLKTVPKIIQEVAHPSMESLAQGQWSRGLGSLRTLWYKPDEATGTFAEFERRARSADALVETELGTRLAGGREFVGARGLGQNVVYCAYLIRYERGVMPWLLAFYQVAGEWKLIGLSSGSSIPEGMLTRFAESPTPGLPVGSE